MKKRVPVVAGGEEVEVSVNFVLLSRSFEEIVAETPRTIF